MKTRTTGSRSADLDSALRSMDVADGPLSAEQQRHAATTLERILATPSTAAAHRPRGVAPRWRSRRRLLLISATATVAALVAAVVELPGGGSAYASWTPDPVALTAAELSLVAPVCRESLNRSDHLDMDRAQLVLSERRGNVVAMLYRTDDPDMAGTCLMHNVPGSDDVDDLNWGVAGGSGPARTAPARGFIPGGAMTGPEVTVTDGAVGAEVVAVTIHAPGDLTARATVKNGRYVVWWPGPDYDVAHEGTAEAQSIVTYDLTFTDGTILHDAPPAK